jgi:hypothetical protein
MHAQNGDGPKEQVLARDRVHIRIDESSIYKPYRLPLRLWHVRTVVRSLLLCLMRAPLQSGCYGFRASEEFVWLALLDHQLKVVISEGSDSRWRVNLDG